MASDLTLRSPRLLLRPVTEGDAAALTVLLAEPAVARYWPGFDLRRVREDFLEGDDDLTVLTVEHQGAVIGLIQLNEESDPQYRHAGIDLFLGSAWHGRGLGSEAIRAVVQHLLGTRQHHRITIDPAADNQRAIRAYERVGFRTVGVLKRYERGADGTWHDGLLMELVTTPGAPLAAAAPAARHIDVSHTIEHGLVTYRGLPAPLVCDYLSRADSRAHYAPGTEFQIGKIEMVGNTGTYLDSPFHRYEGGRDLAGLELSRLAGVPTCVVRLRERRGRAIDADALADLGPQVRGKAVLLDTGWDQHFATDRYFEGHPFLTESAARWLVQAGAVIVGIDSLNIDDTADLRRPAHTLLLGADIPIVEHLTRLDQVPNPEDPGDPNARGARFFAVPVKVRGFGTFPVRAFVMTE